MIKEIKKWGDSKIIVLDKEDLKYLNADVGDMINMVDSFKVNRGDEE
jgi:antitoxin component of MazEF toxin-antitoxin module